MSKESPPSIASVLTLFLRTFPEDCRGRCRFERDGGSAGETFCLCVFLRFCDFRARVTAAKETATSIKIAEILKLTFSVDTCYQVSRSVRILPHNTFHDEMDALGRAHFVSTVWFSMTKRQKLIGKSAIHSAGGAEARSVDQSIFPERENIEEIHQS